MFFTGLPGHVSAGTGNRGQQPRGLAKLRSAGVAAMIALVALGATPQGALANAIVVGHDINTLGSTVAGAQEDSFAVNVASFLTSGSPVRSLLLFESNPGDGTRNFATGVLNALSAAGFVVTVTSNYSTSFAGYDAVFVAQDYPIVGFLDNTALVNYVDGGGSVYLAGGVGPSAGTEAAGWSGFLNHYGLTYATAYNGINSVTITGTDPIFSGITALRSGNGQSILDLGTNPNAHIVQFSGTQGVYAVVSVPEPGNALLLAGGLVVLSLLRRRQVVRGGGAIRPAFL